MRPSHVPSSASARVFAVRSLFVFVVAFAIFATGSKPASAYPQGYTGACSGCHGSAAGTTTTISVPATILPSTAYTVTVTVQNASYQRYGFWLTVDNGTLSSAQSSVTVGGTQLYATHNCTRLNCGSSGCTGTFTLTWTSPSTAGTTTTFSAWGNAVNNNQSACPGAGGGSTGDAPDQATDVTRTTTCASGTHNCSGSCVSNNSTSTCGASCSPCSPPSNATATCNGTSCGFNCNSGYIACSGACATNASKTWYRDQDGDGYGTSGTTTIACTQPVGYVANSSDCNDLSSAVSPAATEICDNVDNNCSGATDEGCDDDNDDHCDKAIAKTAVSVATCVASGTSAWAAGSGDDCNDSSTAVYTGRTETCSDVGTDNDCDGNANEIANGITNGAACSSSGLGVCQPGTYQCVSNAATCVSTLGPSSESCSNTGTDNDCDGNASELTDGVFSGDACSTGSSGICAAGTRACSGGTLVCNQTTPQGTESCSNQGTDNDCDGNASELIDAVFAGDFCTTGLSGVCAAGTRACSGGTLVCNQTTPQGTESCSNTGADNDCDGDATELTDGVHAGDACSTGSPGICAAGVRACSGGVLVCTPSNPSAIETCSNQGTDNDCDGNSAEIADGVVTGDACSTGQLGTCAFGTASCSGTTFTCTRNSPPTTETCANTGTDNDCDGDATEIADTVHAGDVCSTGAQGICAAGKRQCVAGSVACVADNAVGTESCSNTSVDNDCDGDATELVDNVRTGDACATGYLGSCSAGTRACSGSTLVCNAVASPTTETCANTGVDNDCDGDATEIADNVHAGDSCTTSGLGICGPGTRQCVGGVVTCVANFTAGTETCANQGTDDDCDGDATELTNTVHAGDACTSSSPGICAPGARACSGTTLVCNSTVSPGTETCANTGTDDDCDGDATELTDGVHTGDACATGNAGVCSAGTRACSAGVLQCNQTNTAGTETCSNTGTDDDCDNDATEIADNVHTGDTCSTGQPGICAPGTEECGPSGRRCKANVSAGTESCANLGADDDCDGDDTEIANGVHEADACTTTGKGACAPGTERCSGGARVCQPNVTATAETCLNLGVDDDCDGDATEIADGIKDGDACVTAGLGVCRPGKQRCQGGTLRCVADQTAATETCANLGTDDDCDGDANELTDGVHLNDVCSTGQSGICATGKRACASGSLGCTADFTAQTETCANVGVDDDCDGDATELTNGVRPGDTCTTGLFGACSQGKRACDGPLLGCTPNLAPSTEICDGIDNDCDNQVDEGCDDDGDDYCDAAMTLIGSSPACPLGGGDCDDLHASTFPGAVELCDLEDNDCDGSKDEDIPTVTCGFGSCRTTATGCVNGVPQNCIPLPGTGEICDGVDNDCNDLVDDGDLCPAPGICQSGECVVPDGGALPDGGEDADAESADSGQDADASVGDASTDAEDAGVDATVHDSAIDAGRDASTIDATVRDSGTPPVDAAVAADARSDATIADGATGPSGEDGSAADGAIDAEIPGIDADLGAESTVVDGVDVSSDGCSCRTVGGHEGPSDPWAPWAALSCIAALGSIVTRRRSKYPRGPRKEIP
ncbi:MAG: putative metal-binding motif-containing protein [Polyangiaceae bacterium]